MARAARHTPTCPCTAASQAPGARCLHLTAENSLPVHFATRDRLCGYFTLTACHPGQALTYGYISRLKSNCLYTLPLGRRGSVVISRLKPNCPYTLPFGTGSVIISRLKPNCLYTLPFGTGCMVISRLKPNCQALWLPHTHSLPLGTGCMVISRLKTNCPYTLPFGTGSMVISPLKPNCPCKVESTLSHSSKLNSHGTAA